LLAFSWLAAGQSPSPAGRLETLKTKGLDAEVMVLPVRLGDRTMSEMGEVVAMSLEHGAFTVHFVVCDHNGEWVIVDFQNDHFPDFQAMELKSGDDCDRLVTKRLDRFLRAGANGGEE
jgi:hypothetical protein